MNADMTPQPSNTGPRNQESRDGKTPAAGVTGNEMRRGLLGSELDTSFTGPNTRADKEGAGKDTDNAPTVTTGVGKKTTPPASAKDIEGNPEKSPGLLQKAPGIAVGFLKEAAEKALMLVARPLLAVMDICMPCLATPAVIGAVVADSVGGWWSIPAFLLTTTALYATAYEGSKVIEREYRRQKPRHYDYKPGGPKKGK